MLRISRDQLAAIAASSTGAANLRLAIYARERFPQEFHSTSDDELVSLVQDVRRRAKGHGVENENDIATALDLTIMYGPGFYREEWASDVFQQGGCSGAQKMEVLRTRFWENGVSL